VTVDDWTMLGRWKACSTRRSVGSKTCPPLRASLTHTIFYQHAAQRFIAHQLPLSRNMAEDSVTLTEVETTLKRLLLDVVDFVEKNPAASSDDASQIALPDELAKSPLELRWTGGWVRDKLLGKDSNDIDVAINKMTGYQFGLCIKAYLDIAQNADRYRIPGSAKSITSKLAKIDANPDKSKHLETTTTKILGLDIDLVNLRKETYADDSRNPQVEFGTPEEDAMRRDATINAMFYNLHTSKVEDFTKHGLSDLKNGIIRTPLEPHSTFIDDPLRVLRLIRFASRYGYEIDEGTKDSMKSSEIHDAFLKKITKERVLTELEKMLKGPDPHMALDLINSTGMYNFIFTAPEYPGLFKPDTRNWSRVYDMVLEIVDAKPGSSSSVIKEIAVQNKDELFQTWFIGAIVPWADAPPLPSKKPGKALPTLAAIVVREGLRGPTKLIDLVESAVKNMKEIKRIVEDKVSKRDEVGMAIRTWGSTWRQQVVFTMLHEILVGPTDTTGKLSEM
jgi:tRNA nucleotidyltransferase (CCA-adding enzyme)